MPRIFTTLYISSITAISLSACVTTIVGQAQGQGQGQAQGQNSSTDSSSNSSSQSSSTSQATSEPSTTNTNIKGDWQDGGGTIISVTQDGDKVTATYPDGRGPFTGEFTSKTVLKMSFPDVSADCCTADVTDTMIKWSDDTTWQKKE